MVDYQKKKRVARKGSWIFLIFLVGIVLLMNFALTENLTINWTESIHSITNGSGIKSATALAYDNKMWVIGGWYGSDKSDDVWYSTDGIAWIKATDSAEFSGRTDHTSVVYDNKMWVIGGEVLGGQTDSVWYSTILNFCTPNMTNTSWSSWYDITSCRINDTILQERNLTQYDQNFCGEISNTTFFEYQETACNYCSYNVANATDAWANITSCQANDTILQQRNITEYDLNYSTCYLITSLPSDLWNSGNNNTYTESQEIACDYCTPNWVLNDTWGECQLINLQFKNYYDNNSCNEGTIPDPFNKSCEFTFINGSTNLTENYTGVLEVIFKQGNEILAEFNYNFSSNILNLSNITIERENGVGAVKGYIFVRGIKQEGTKTLYLQNVSPNFNWVCIKDVEILDISEITPNCKGANEYHIQCNNKTNEGYRCEDLGNKAYKITGLNHSGIIQADAIVNSGTGGGGGGGGSTTTPIVSQPIQPTPSKLSEIPTLQPQQPNETEKLPIEGEVKKEESAKITGAVIGNFIKGNLTIILVFVGIVLVSFTTFKILKRKKN